MRGKRFICMLLSVALVTNNIHPVFAIAREAENDLLTEELVLDSNDDQSVVESEKIQESEPTQESEEIQETEEVQEVQESEEIQVPEGYQESEETQEPGNVQNEEEVSYPAYTFTPQVISGVTVEASVDEGVFPEGTEMIVTSVSSDVMNQIKDTANELIDDQEEVSDVVAVDICFYYEGNEIQPKDGKSVHVNLRTNYELEGEDHKVLHYQDSYNAEIVAEASSTEASIEADSFSIYAIIGTETISTQYLTADGKSYTITVTYGPEAEIPKGSTLEVSEIAEDSEAYSSYCDMTQDYLDQVEAGELVEARYFDISIMHDGQKVEPNAAVDVSIHYDNPIAKESEDSAYAIHFGNSGTELINVETDSEVNISQVEFQQGSFSVTGTITTTLSSNGNYVIVVEHDGLYYAVMYDGTLQEVNYSNGKVYIDMTELWKYSSSRLSVTTNNGTTYISPTSDSGISTSRTNITYSGNKLYNGSSYIGISMNALGEPANIVGNVSSDDAANVYFATVGSPSGTTVDHIDIGVTASASVNVPLAYGNYYNSNGNLVLSVPQGAYINATGTNDNVDITESDLMSATISSYTKGSDGNTDVNSFIIDEYTSSSGSSGINQVRIGGTFPVGTISNQVYYEVEVVKPVELTLSYNGETLYDTDGNALKVTVNASLAASFSYWDLDNDCPGIRNKTSWQRGSVSSGSGMDFVLGTTDEQDSSVTAVEIVKSVVDQDGNLIAVASEPTYTYDVFENTSASVDLPTNSMMLIIMGFSISLLLAGIYLKKKENRF